MRMKAVQFSKYGKADVLHVAKNISKPTVDENQVLIRVKATGINPLDIYVRAGQSSPVDLPHTTGLDAAGVVEAVGPGVDRFSAGERVYTLKAKTGACAEFTVADEAYVGHLDEKMTFEEGACIGIPYYTAYKALFLLADAKEGDNVLIHGASGGVGMAATQLARARNLKVYGTAGTPEGLDFAKENGCSKTFNHKDKNYVPNLLQDTCDEGFDVILEMAAHINLNKDIELMRKNGRTIIIGSRSDAKITPSAMMATECILQGMSVLRSSSEQLNEIRAAIETGQKEGWIKPKIEQSFPMDKASEAHTLFSSRKGAKGKIVITV